MRLRRKRTRLVGPGYWDDIGDSLDSTGSIRTMPRKFDPLARYNSERTRGIVHTPEWVEQMKALQREFDEWNVKAGR